MRHMMLACTSLLTLAVAAPRVGAHHSPAAYDQQAVVSIEGTVAEYRWASPHVYLTIREDAGERVWEIETFPPSTLKQMGWSRDALATGDRVSITANPGRNPARNIASLLTLSAAGATLYDGTKVFAGGEAAADRPTSPPRAADSPAASGGLAALVGTWDTSAEPVLGLFFGRAATLPVTPEGAAAIRDFTDAENPGADCVPFTAPAYVMLPGFKHIEMRGDTVVIRGEIDAVERVVHLGTRTHDGAPPSVQGHSIGAWDGEALVVDTARFAGHRLGLAAGLPSSSEKHLVERFELDAGGRALTYRFTLEDPEYLVQPVEGTLRWVARPDVEFTPTACDLEIARRFRQE